MNLKKIIGISDYFDLVRKKLPFYINLSVKLDFGATKHRLGSLIIMPWNVLVSIVRFCVSVRVHLTPLAWQIFLPDLFGLLRLISLSAVAPLTSRCWSGCRPIKANSQADSGAPQCRLPGSQDTSIPLETERRQKETETSREAGPKKTNEKKKQKVLVLVVGGGVMGMKSVRDYIQNPLRYSS